MNIELTVTTLGHPALWEYGGGATNTGKAQVICDNLGEPVTPVFIKTGGHLACGEHALIPIRITFHVILVSRHREDFDIQVFQIDGLNVETKQASLTEIAHFEMGEWNPGLPIDLARAVEAAKNKSQDYHCRKPFYIKTT